MGEQLIFSLLSNVLGQLRTLVSLLEDEKYTRTLSSLNGATIGQHIRHVLEFYLCLFRVLESVNPVVNYGNRRRDTYLEAERAKALDTIRYIETQLQKYTQDRALTLISPTEGAEIQASSSLYREYIFNLDHTVHHMALLRIGVQEADPLLTLDDSFGVAKETIEHHKLMETRA